MSRNHSSRILTSCLSLISVFGIYLFLFNSLGYSQSQAVRNAIAPSPNAASLGRIPVNLYAGREQVVIPIYTVSDNNISLPIYLSYHGGGIKVEEVASWVGLGWTLNAGGVITRTVRGLPDGNSGFDNVDVDYKIVDPDDYDDYANNTVDSKPDLFSFKFNGRAGQFVYHNDYGVIPIPYQKIKIEPFLSADSIRITTEDGTKYIFSEVEVTHSITESKINIVEIGWDLNSSVNKTFKSSWYLTKIVSVNGNSITLDYDQETVNFTKKGSEAYYECQEGGPRGCDEVGVFRSVHTQVTYTITCKRLNQINFKSGRVEFTAGTNSNYAGNKRLQNIKIYNYNNELLKTIDFYHSTINDRLYLDSLKESNQDVEKNPYYFYYYSSYSLPSRNSYSQDWVGCYNGKNTSDYFSFGVNIINIKDLDRTPNIAYAKAGTLIEIKYPTGGYSVFDYEINTTSTSGYSQLGGLRIDKITDHDPVNSVSQIREFSYNTGNLIGNPPGAYTTFSQGPFDYKIYTSYSNSPLTYSFGSPVGYIQVTITYKNGSAENGKSEFTYNWENDTYDDTCGGDSEGKEWMRGQLLKQVDFKKDGSGYDTVRKIENTYYYYHHSKPSSDPYIQPRYSNMSNKYVMGFTISNGLPYCPHYFKTSSGYYELVKTREYTYNEDGQTYVMRETNMSYNEDDLNLKEIVTTGSDGRNITVKYKYPLEYTSTDNISDDGQNTAEAVGISKMVGKHVINVPVETLKKLGNNYIDASILTFRYDEGIIVPYNVYTWKTEVPRSGFTESYLYWNSGAGRWEFVKDQYYQSDPEITFEEFDSDGNLLEYYRTDDIHNSFIYSYNNTLPIAEVENAIIDEIAYTGFESGNKEGNWSGYSSSEIVSGGFTGKKCLYIDAAITCYCSLDPDKSYIVSFYGKGSCTITVDGDDNDKSVQLTDSDHWKYYEVKLDNGNSNLEIDIPTYIYIDDLRLYHADAQMTTYTYEPLIGVTSVMDQNNLTTHYKYDELGRLKTIRDQDGNILKHIDYHYKDQ